MDTDLWLTCARRSQSPNFDQRPDGCDIDLLVIHNISLPPGEFAGDYIEDFFHNRLNSDKHPYFKQIAGLRVSAHILIRRDGDIVQFVPLNQRAWHAGESVFDGCSRCNDFSIGVELEGSDDQNFTDAQYRALIQVSQEIRKCYPNITRERVTGHSDIAPGRKTDPGPHFDWQRLLHGMFM